MPTRSPRDEPARTIRDLGLPGRAVTALTRAGVTRVQDLAVLTRRDLAAINGLGPGSIAAIRLVVPEPPTSAARSGNLPTADRDHTAGPGPDDEESPAAPPIPSLDSLRASRRGTAVDLLLPGPSASTPSPSTPSPSPSPSATPPRPPDYADLLRLAVHVGWALAALPVRMVRWSVREPVRHLRSLLGG